jgi:hypothetical protein
MKRVLKPGGLFLYMGSGASKLGLYNQYLRFRAGLDLQKTGRVEHLNLEEIMQEDPDFEKVHTERKALGMTYIGILKKK